VPNIGFTRHGGLGDGVVATAIVESIKEKYPDDKITGYIAGSVREVFKGNGRVVEAEYEEVSGVLTEDLIRGKYPWDLFFDLKPIPGVFFCPDFGNLTEKQKDWQGQLKGFSYPDDIRLLEQFGLRQIEFICEVLDLPVKNPIWNKFSRINHLYSNKGFYNQNPTPEPLTYVTLGNEAWGQCQTKSYPFWDRIIPHIGLPVYQLGAQRQETIPGAINKTGELALWESCQLVCNAKYHLGIEGFFGHFCEIWKIPRIIFFGPTSDIFFSYESEVVISNKECRNCQWLSGNWMNFCPKGYSYLERPCVLGLEEKIIESINHL